MIVDHYGVVHVPVPVDDGARPACMLGRLDNDVIVELRVPSRAPTCLWCATIRYPLRLRYVSRVYIV